MIVAAFLCVAPIVVDGDTIRCQDHGRIRLLGIDAPERAGHCRQGRDCAPGDPEAARLNLEWALGYGPLQVQPFAKDRYGRLVATVRAGAVDLSCWQLRYHHARYMPHWDNGGRIAKLCPDLTDAQQAVDDRRK